MKSVFIVWIFLLVFIATACGGSFFSPPAPKPSNSKINSYAVLTQESLRKLLSNIRHKTIVQEQFHLRYQGSLYSFHTTIEQELQNYLDNLLEDSIAAKAAIVCVDPLSGKVIAMSGFDKKQPVAHAYTSVLVPGASLFKIVTAAGLLEMHGFSPDSLVSFSGGRHTLYKSQLSGGKNSRYVTNVTFREAFAQSINPVFGKLGRDYLGRDGLLIMAKRFLWQQFIPFELPVAISTIDMNNPDGFYLAQIASGYNKRTKLTALHACLMASGIANGGVIMAPFFIDYVYNEDTGKIVYQGMFYPLKRCINPKTANYLQEMMKATIKEGTAKKAFKGADEDKILRTLIIGGKTGTMDNLDHSIRFELFSGFACNQELLKCMAMGIVVGHERLIGLRASQYARLVIKKYFEILIKRDKKGVN